MDAQHVKALTGTLVAVAAQTLGTVALSRGLRGRPQGLAGWRRALHLAVQPIMWLAVALLAVNWFLWLAVLSWAPLSFVNPLTATGYILNALLVGPLLGERMSGSRWLGTLLVFLGVMVIVLEPRP